MFIGVGTAELAVWIRGISAMRWHQGWIFWGRKLGMFLESVTASIYLCWHVIRVYSS